LNPFYPQTKQPQDIHSVCDINMVRQRRANYSAISQLKKMLLEFAAAGRIKRISLLLGGQNHANAEDPAREQMIKVFFENAGQDINDVNNALLTTRVDVTTENEDKETALIIASRYGYKALVELLLTHGADVSKGGIYGSSLKVASAEGHKAVAKLARKRSEG
jgi:ankyrin repeat protein